MKTTAAHVKRRQELWDVWLNSGCFNTCPGTYLAQDQHHIGMLIPSEREEFMFCPLPHVKAVIIGTGFNCIKSYILFFFLKASLFKFNLCVDKSYQSKSLKHLFFCISTVTIHTLHSLNHLEHTKNILCQANSPSNSLCSQQQ